MKIDEQLIGPDGEGLTQMVAGRPGDPVTEKPFTLRDLLLQAFADDQSPQLSQETKLHRGQLYGRLVRTKKGKDYVLSAKDVVAVLEMANVSFNSLRYTLLVANIDPAQLPKEPDAEPKSKK